jgi:hypothetical protein
VANSLCCWVSIAGFSITLIGVALVDVFCLCLFYFLHYWLYPKLKETNFKSKIRAYHAKFKGIKFVFNNKTVLGAITLDMVAVLFGAVALLPIFARHS